MPTRLFAILVVSGLAPAVPAQEPPRAVIERAIVAHGGHARLALARCERVRLKGTMHVGSASLPFTNELAVALPGRYKSVVTIDDGTRTRQVVHVLDGEKAAALVDGQPQTVTGVHLAQLRQTLQLEHAMRLMPLLTDAEFRLSGLGQVRYNNQVFAGVQVAGRGQRELKLWFDQASGLLVKSEHKLDGPGGKDVLQEAFYADYRDAGGYRRPGKVVVLRDGKKVMEAELIDARRCERFEPDEFSTAGSR